MRQEQEAGLEYVSAELAPQVRHAAFEMAFLSTELWTPLMFDVLVLSGDRFDAIASTGDIPQALEPMAQTLCTFRTNLVMLTSFEDGLPQLQAIVATEDLKY